MYQSQECSSKARNEVSTRPVDADLVPTPAFIIVSTCQPELRWNVAGCRPAIPLGSLPRQSTIRNVDRAWNLPARLAHLANATRFPAGASPKTNL